MLSPTANAQNDAPQRASAAVFNTEWDDVGSLWILTLCPRWTEAQVGDGYSLTFDGVNVPVNTSPVPFRPGWLWPDVPAGNCVDISAPTFAGGQEQVEFAVTATSGGAPPLTVGTTLSTSCNATILPVDSFSSRGASFACGAPGFAPELRLSGTGAVVGNSTTFSLNHSLSGRNASTYHYQYSIANLPVQVWFNIEPTSSATIDGGNLSQPAAQDGYRLANFTFENNSADAETRVLWRVRASDTFTLEMSPYSCEVSLNAVRDSFARSCYTRRSTGAEGNITFPFVDLASIGTGLGVGEAGAGYLAVLVMAIVLAFLGIFASRSLAGGAGGVALAMGVGFVFGATPGWVLVISFYVCSLMLLARVFPGGQQ